jgi:hypothetical protein
VPEQDFALQLALRAQLPKQQPASQQYTGHLSPSRHPDQLFTTAQLQQYNTPCSPCSAAQTGDQPPSVLPHPAGAAGCPQAHSAEGSGSDTVTIAALSSNARLWSVRAVAAKHS